MRICHAKLTWVCELALTPTISNPPLTFVELQELVDPNIAYVVTTDR